MKRGAQAQAFLRRALAGAPRRTPELLREAAELGISRRTLYRARDELGVQTLFAGGLRGCAGRLMGTYWRLPRPLSGHTPQGSAEEPVSPAPSRWKPLLKQDLRWIV